MKQKSSFRGLREGVRRFFAFEADRLAQAEDPRPVSAAPAPSPHVSAGRFGLIGLAEIRESVGARWPALEGRVRALAEAVIARHLTPGDVFEAQDDGSYVVLFAQLSEEAAVFKCRVIGREISERLLGSDSPRLADVESVSAQVTREALSSGDIESVFAEAFAAGEATISTDPSSPRPPAADLNAITSRLPGESPAAPGAPVRPGQSQTGAFGPQGGAGGAVFVSVPHDKPGQVEAVWRYAPVWDFKSMSLVRFRLTPGRTWAGRETPEAPFHHGGAFEVDLGTVSKALADLAKLHQAGRRLIVIGVVHQGSLSVQWRRDQLIGLVGAAPSDVRRLLRIEVSAPEFRPTPALSHFVTAIDALGVHCSVCVPLASRTPVRPAGMPLRTAAVEASAQTLESEALPLLNTFSRRSAQVGLDSAAHRLDSRSLVIGAVAAGVRFLSGKAVRADVEDLAQGLRFEPSDLYRDLLLSGPG